MNLRTHANPSRRIALMLWAAATIMPTLWASLASADDWAQFRHDAQRTAATSEEFSGKPTIRWKRAFEQWPHVFAELAVVQGKVYLANMDGKVTCMDGQTGDVAWEYDTGAAIPTTPAVVDGRIHVLNLKGRLVTLDLSGKLLWEFQAPGDIYANPVVGGGRIFFGTVGGIFYCLDAKAGGKPLWQRKVGAMIDAAPCLLNDTVIFAAENMKAFALKTSDGSIAWTTELPGSRTWNGHPLASAKTNRVYFTTLVDFEEPTSTFREVYGMQYMETQKGPLADIMHFADTFVAKDRQRLQPGEVLDGASGKPIRQFTVAGDDSVIGGLPCNSWYWSSIRPCLWQGDKLFLQSAWRNILVDLGSNRVFQPNADLKMSHQFVRGDEQVPTSIGGDKAYGGIGGNLTSLDLKTGNRDVMLGVQGVEQADATPLTPPLSREHYEPFPGDGYSDRIGTFIVANGHGYYVQYGWVYCFDAQVKNVGDEGTPGK